MSVETEEFKAAADRLVRWREHPSQFVREVFGAEPEPWQEEVLEAFPGEPAVAMAAAKGCGKSTVEAWIIWNFLATRPHPNIACVSVTGSNLKDNLWKELAVWRKRAPMLEAGFEQTSERIYHKGHHETWWCSARSFPKDGNNQEQADALAGLHADYCMAVLDESGGIPPGVLATAEAVLTSRVEGHVLQGGNTTDVASALYASTVTRASSWRCFHITGDPDDPKRSARVSPEYALRMIRDYGRDDDRTRVNVFALWPKQPFTRLLGLEHIQVARKRSYRQDAIDEFPKVLGVDVAFQGGDLTVIYPRQGPVAFTPIVLSGQTPYRVAAAVAQEWDRFGADGCFVDNTGGYGMAVIMALQQLGRRPVPVGFAEGSREAGFANRRAEMLYGLAEWVKTTGSLTGPAEHLDELCRELVELEYWRNGDKIQIIAKDDIREALGGRSPDYSDALALTFAAPVRALARSDLERVEAQMQQGKGGEAYDFFGRAAGSW